MRGPPLPRHILDRARERQLPKSAQQHESAAPKPRAQPALLMDRLVLAEPGWPAHSLSASRLCLRLWHSWEEGALFRGRYGVGVEGRAGRNNRKVKAMIRAYGGGEAATLCSSYLLDNRMYTRGTHYVCNLDKLMTSQLCLLHYIIDQFRNTCDNIFYLNPYNHFHSMR